MRSSGANLRRYPNRQSRHILPCHEHPANAVRGRAILTSLQTRLCHRGIILCWHVGLERARAYRYFSQGTSRLCSSSTDVLHHCSSGLAKSKALVGNAHRALKLPVQYPEHSHGIHGLDPWASVIWVSQSADGFSFVTRTFSHEIVAG